LINSCTENFGCFVVLNLNSWEEVTCYSILMILKDRHIGIDLYQTLVSQMDFGIVDSIKTSLCTFFCIVLLRIVISELFRQHLDCFSSSDVSTQLCQDSL